MSVDNIETPLYSPDNMDDNNSINYWVRRNFNSETIKIPDSLKNYIKVSNLVNMLDFSRNMFDKTIALIPKKDIEILTKWSLEKLSSVCEIKNGATPDTNVAEYWEGGTIPWATLVDVKVKYVKDTKRKITNAGAGKTTLLPVGTVLLSSRATIGEVAIASIPMATNQGFKNFICDSKKIESEFLYYLLKRFRNEIENLVPSGSKYKEINSTQMGNVKIPVPPLEVQREIIKACLEIDQQYNKIRMDISKYNEYMKEAFKKFDISTAESITTK